MKRAVLIIFLVVITTLTACAGQNKDKNNAVEKQPNIMAESPAITTEGSKSIVPEVAPPIEFSTIEEGEDLLIKHDLSKYYSENVKQLLEKMFSRISQNNQLNKFAFDQNRVSWFEKDGKKLFYFMPESKNEDLGIYYYVVFGDEVYNVAIYYKNNDIAKATGDFKSYLQSRLPNAIFEENNFDGKSIFVEKWGTGDNQGLRLFGNIDDNVYYCVKVPFTNGDYTDILNYLTF